MSKRSSRKKRQQQRHKQHAKLSGPLLVEQGRQAFNQGIYDEAIRKWQQAQHKKDAPSKLTLALAEAHFRWAVTSPTPSLPDLQQAIQFRPDALHYQYHLALAHHRLGQLNEAEAIYRDLLAASPPFERAAEPLAQLLIEQKKPLSKDPIFKLIEPTAKTQLVAAEALVKKKATSTLKKLAETELEPVWRGLIAVALGDTTSSKSNFQSALDSGEFPPMAASVIHYYLGLFAATEQNIDLAAEHWQTARNQGLTTDALHRNFDKVTYHRLIAARQAKQPAEALNQLDKIRWLGYLGINANTLRRQLNWEMADAAAQKGDWDQALLGWQMVHRLGEDSRALAFNLALAYQKTEHHWEAAEQWRLLLRRRPRKADHPDYLTDEQVVRIWQNVADNYTMAGDYEEAIKTYKTAIKWGPEKLDLRLKLVEALQADGRWQAAENELNRILKKDPDHVPAILALADSYSGHWRGQYRARELLLKALELEPQNPIARQQFAVFTEQQCLFELQWGQTKEALDILEEGRRLLPNHQRLLLVTSTTYFSMGDVDAGRPYLEQAIAVNPQDLQTLFTAYLSWLKAGSIPDADKTFAQIKAVNLPIPSDFFLELIMMCVDMGHEAQAEKLIDYTKSRYQTDVPTMLTLAAIFRDMEDEKRALNVLRQVIKDNPDHAEANLHLGTLYFELDQTRLAKRHWQKAEAQAQKENDQMLLYQIKTTRDVHLHGKQPPQSIGQVFSQMPPELLDQMINEAPPEVAEMLRGMPPDMVEMMINAAMGEGDIGMPPFDLFGEDDEEDEYGW